MAKTGRAQETKSKAIQSMFVSKHLCLYARHDCIDLEMICVKNDDGNV